MTALRGLKLIFPADVNPLYAGFGNSVSDMVAYKKASEPQQHEYTASSFIFVPGYLAQNASFSFLLFFVERAKRGAVQAASE